MATAEENEMIPIEVAFAQPDRQSLLPLMVPAGTTVKEAIIRSGILDLFPEIELQENKVGIFGRLCGADRVLEAGDRVEIYRPLLADPKEVRRRLAAEGRSMGQPRGGKTS